MKDEDPDEDMPLEFKRVSSIEPVGCGTSIYSNDPEIKSLQYSWLVDICVDYKEDKLDSSGNKISCGELCKGTLITKSDVITSASCVKTSDENNTVVFLGSHNIQDSLDSLDYQFLAKNGFVWNPPVRIYPDFTLNGTEEYKRSPDVALIKLEKSVDFGPSVNQICLRSIGEAQMDFSNAKAIFASRNQYKQ